MTVSVGLATLASGEKKTFEDLLKGADATLYEAKEGGKNRVETGEAALVGAPEGGVDACGQLVRKEKGLAI